MKFQVVNIWQDNPPQWSNDHGTFDAYLLNLRGEDGSEHGSVGLNKKAGNAPPAEGTIVEGEINQTGAGPKLKIAVSQGGGGGGGARPAGGGGGASGGGGGFPAHVQASITYQHSQDVAVALMTIMPVPNGEEEVLKLHRRLSGMIAKDVQRVWDRHGGPERMGAGPAAAEAAPAPAQAPPVAQGGFGTQQPAAPAQGGFGAAPGGGGFGQPAPVAAPADDDIPF